MDIAERLGVGIEDLRQRLRILEDKGLIQEGDGSGRWLLLSQMLGLPRLRMR